MQNGTVQNGTRSEDRMQDGTMPDPIEDPRQDTTSDLLGWEQDRWEKDPTVWQHPHAPTPYGDSLVQTYEAAHLDGEVTVIDLMLGLDQYQEATEEFEEYLIAMVQSRAMQLAPDRVEPVEAEALLKLPKRAQLRVFDQLTVLASQVFDWMRAQGMDPVPGATTLPPLVTAADRKRIQNS
ncbi:hypothetical protein E7744_07155 [Citricoccus sp. SGAir0253]|uniref:hypothetical protein n=1 Tax=Citricoccus sp. SGAir0253 TaxID=2567881 RepID=UPI0010CCB9BC|nr:hypothetical protein [Citricoccus sp. SGAir0253]QCU77984.1 hypothetical protein E7744_07155 [Citricoccus sp. SGAir0253]